MFVWFKERSMVIGTGKIYTDQFVKLLPSITSSSNQL
jgi:hypothetical protein